MAEETVLVPGSVQINDIILASLDNAKYVNLTDYLIELNIYESIFTPVISGTITLTDSRNLIREFPLIGEEILFINVKTPLISDEMGIYKAFRIYSINDKTYAKDGSTLIYQLGFSSIEAFNDILNPIYKSFKGKPEDIVSQIYFDYLQAARNITFNNKPDETKTPLTILSESDNNIKFVSPGWSPVECINWIASKTLPKNNKAANFLFWETTKGFYFGSTDSIYEKSTDALIGTYVYSESYINTLKPDERHKGMAAIKSMSIETTFDQMENLMSGYISNRIIDVDLYNKTYHNKDYDHADSFDNYNRSDIEPSVPLFSKTTLRNPLVHTDLNYSYPTLHTNIPNNFDEQVKYIHGNRRSNLLELNNFKMKLVIPGRTDIEAGTMIYIKVPKKTPGALTSADDVDYRDDDLYSGYYLITSLSHKINPKTHYITMDVTKDSLPKKVFNDPGAK